MTHRSTQEILESSDRQAAKLREQNQRRKRERHLNASDKRLVYENHSLRTQLGMVSKQLEGANREITKLKAIAERKGINLSDEV